MANKGTEIQIGDGSLHIGDRVVYPNQGICRITGVEVKQIAGRDWEVVTLSRDAVPDVVFARQRLHVVAEVAQSAERPVAAS